MAKRKKPATQAAPPPSDKVPRIAKEARSDTSIVSWQFSALDEDGPWGWNTVDAATISTSVLPRIKAFETMTWADIEGKTGSHFIDVYEIIPNAQRRLSDIGQDDVDCLFSLRLQGRQRIWGIRDRNIFKVLWWDPEHAICPSVKKHT